MTDIETNGYDGYEESCEDTITVNNVKIHDKIIIGAGAAGLMAAYSACQIGSDSGYNPDIVVLESGEMPGRKITATGNGKCNLTNTNQTQECYRSSDSAKAFRIINRFDYKKTLELFKTFGVLHSERNGYCYPYGEQARTLRDVLVSKVESMGAQIKTSKKVCGIEKTEGTFIVSCEDGSVYKSKKLIVTTGGAAAPVFGSDGSLFFLLKEIGLNIKPLMPALCGLTSNYKYLRRIDGVRLRCNCKLYSGKYSNILYSERGEIVFNKKGLSGIPIMNLSRFAIEELYTSVKKRFGNNSQRTNFYAERKVMNNKVGVILDFFPDIDLKELKEYMCSVVMASVVPIGTALSALINDKLLKACMADLELDYDEKTIAYDSKTITSELGKLAEILKGLDIHITGDVGFENAQTTQGGVILKEIDEKSMESYKYPGMFFAGEILDVDGMCGGYNLQWAWTTGYIAGRN